MNENIKKILLEYKVWHDEIMSTYGFRNPECYVFVTYAGEPLGEFYLKRVIDLICEREKISHFSPHYLRHTFVSIQLSKNVPIITVVALVGDTPEPLRNVGISMFTDKKTLINKMSARGVLG